MNHRIGAFDSLVPAPKDGESPKILELSPPLIAHPIDSATKKTIGKHTYCVHVRVLQDNEALELSNDYDCTASSVVNVSAEVYTYFMERCFQIFITIPDGIEKYSPIDVMTITVSHKSGFSVSSTITISYVQRGSTGLPGKTIPQPYDCGWWDVGTTYVVKNNYAPRVAYPKTSNPQVYVRTENPLKYGSDGKPLDPATDYATYGGTGAWLLFEKYAAILVDLLMANWARFGSPEGGVFWEHYLFSALGVPQGGGSVVDYSVYADSSSPIFDVDTKELTGIWTPNLFIDFKTGRIICKNADITGVVNATSGNFKGTIEANGGTFKNGEVNIANGKIVFNRDGSGSIANKGLVWSSLGEMYQSSGMQPLWLSVLKAITLKGRFTYFDSYGGHMLDSLLGVYFNTQWDATEAGDNCYQYLLLPRPQTYFGLGVVDEIYIKISKRELFFFWFKTDDYSNSFYILCHKEGFIKLKNNSGGITSLKKGAYLLPKEGVICKFEYTGSYWLGESMDFNTFTL